MDTQNTQTFEFFGRSDDLFCLSGESFIKEISGKEELTFGLIQDDTVTLLVVGKYMTEKACWEVTLMSASKRHFPLEDWDFKHSRTDNGCHVIINTPDDVKWCVYEK